MPIVQKVYKNKSNGQKRVTVPAESDIVEGDYVHIRKVSPDYEERPVVDAELVEFMRKLKGMVDGDGQ